MAAITGAVGRRRLMIDEKKLINNLTIRREKLRYISIVALHNNMNYVDTIINEINSIIDIINEQPKVGEWIPCSERLPKEVRAVEVTMYDGSRAIGHYYKRLEAWFDSINDGAIDVIAWKEPSEPWEGGKE